MSINSVELIGIQVWIRQNENSAIQFSGPVQFWNIPGGMFQKHTTAGASLISFAPSKEGWESRGVCFLSRASERLLHRRLLGCWAGVSEPQRFVPEALQDSADGYTTVAQLPRGFRPASDHVKEGRCLDSLFPHI